MGSGPNTPVAHKKSEQQMLYDVYDYTSQAIKVVHHDSTSYSFTLNGDTDSVLAISETAQINAVNTPVPCAGMHQAGLHVVSGGTVSVQVNMQDAGGAAPWITIVTGATTGYQIIPICARQIQVIVASGTPVFYMCVQG